MGEGSWRGCAPEGGYARADAPAGRRAAALARRHQHHLRPTGPRAGPRALRAARRRTPRGRRSAPVCVRRARPGWVEMAAYVVPVFGDLGLQRAHRPGAGCPAGDAVRVGRLFFSSRVPSSHRVAASSLSQEETGITRTEGKERKRKVHYFRGRSGLVSRSYPSRADLKTSPEFF